MNIKIIFRILLITSILLPIVAVTISEVSLSSQTQEMQDLVAWDGYGGAFWPENESGDLSTGFFVGAGVLIVVLILCIISFIGFYLFKHWSRPLMVGVTIFTVLCTPFMGVLISMPIPNSINYTSGMIFGALLAMAYLEPINSEFKKPNK